MHSNPSVNKGGLFESTSTRSILFDEENIDEIRTLKKTEDV